MKIKAVTKILIDVIMTVLLVILTFDFGTTLFFHEVAGIAVYVLYTVHIILNFKWIKNIMFGRHKNIGVENVLKIIISATLFASMLTVLISGVVISRILFTFGSESHTAALVHTVSSYIGMAAVALHLLMHLKYLAVSFVAIGKNIITKNVLSVLASAGAMIAVVITVYVQVFTNFNSVNADISFNTGNTSEISSEETSTTPVDDNMSDTYVTDDVDDDGKKDEAVVDEKLSQSATVEEYLSKLFCTGCHNHCLLISPSCGIGGRQKIEAKQTYNDYVMTKTEK